MTGPGRNDPCPCGSGRKYKRCCGAQAAAEAAQALRRPLAARLDDETSDELFRMGRRWLGAARLDAEIARLVGWASWEDALPVVVPCLLHESRFGGDETLAERALREGRIRERDARRWVEAQREAWTSAWEVKSVKPEEGVHVKDLLTGRERFVTDVIASRSAVARGGMLARIVDFDDASWIAGVHPVLLSPRATRRAATLARSALRLRGRTKPETLRDAEATRALLAAWNAELTTSASQPPPSLANTDGDSLLFTKDHFLFVPADRPRLLEALAAMPDAELSPSEDGAPDVVRISRTEPDGIRTTLVALLRVAEDSLVIETNSLERADRMRRRIARAAAGLLRHRAREHEAAEAAMRRWEAESAAAAGPAEPEIDPAQAARVARDWKERHYAGWPDTPLPALGGRTPREAAAGDARQRGKLRALLAELEFGEARQPEGSRYDVGILRRELGVDD
jgi:hypothetical protein